MDDFINKHLATVITALLGALAWANEKRKKKAEVQKVESDALEAMQQAYKTFVQDLNHNYLELKIKVEYLEKEVVEWKDKYRILKEEMNILENGVNVTSNVGKGKRKRNDSK